jgi:anti-sigma factor RsiW
MVTDTRSQQLMQAALDGELSSQHEAELGQLLDNDPEQAAEYDAQQRVDALLRYPPMARAPQRLGLAIMARLAQTLAEGQKARGHTSALTQAQLQVAIQLVTVTTLPMLSGAGYLLLNAQSKPEAVEQALRPAIALLVIVIDAMTMMLEQAEAVYEEDPQMAVAILMLMPPALLVLVEKFFDDAPDSDKPNP